MSSGNQKREMSEKTDKMRRKTEGKEERGQKEVKSDDGKV